MWDTGSRVAHIDHGRQKPTDADRDEPSFTEKDEFCAIDCEDLGNGQEDGQLEAVKGECVVAQRESTASAHGPQQARQRTKGV